MAKNIKTKILFLRISYWVGAILDALYIIPMLFPEMGGKIFGISNFNPDGTFRYAMFTGAALMLGWTVLLIWADKKPVERRWILFLTIIPVKIGLDLASISLVINNIIPLKNLLISKIDGLLYYILIIFSLLYSKNLPSKNETH